MGIYCVAFKTSLPTSAQHSIGILVFGIRLHFHPTINVSSINHNSMFAAVTEGSLNFQLKPDIKLQNKSLPIMFLMTVKYLTVEST
jgi:hypothetical protein